MTKLAVLGNDLEEMLTAMIIVEDLNTASLSRSEFDLYHEIKNPESWGRYDSSTRKYRKKQKDNLMLKYGTGVHAQLSSLISTQLGTLLNN
jgi:hypothetical protein